MSSTLADTRQSAVHRPSRASDSEASDCSGRPVLSALAAFIRGIQAQFCSKPSMGLYQGLLLLCLSQPQNLLFLIHTMAAPKCSQSLSPGDSRCIYVAEESARQNLHVPFLCNISLRCKISSPQTAVLIFAPQTLLLAIPGYSALLTLVSTRVPGR